MRDPEVFRYADRFVAIPDGSLLGIEIDEAVVVAGPSAAGAVQMHYR